MATLWASFSAWIMFIVGTALFALALGKRLFALLGEVPGDVGIDVLEHRADVVLALLGEDAQVLGLLLRRAHRAVALGAQRGMALFVPFAERHQVRLQALDGVAERPRLGLVGWPVA